LIDQRRISTSTRVANFDYFVHEEPAKTVVEGLWKSIDDAFACHVFLLYLSRLSHVNNRRTLKFTPQVAIGWLVVDSRKDRACFICEVPSSAVLTAAFSDVQDPLLRNALLSPITKTTAIALIDITTVRLRVKLCENFAGAVVHLILVAFDSHQNQLFVRPADCALGDWASRRQQEEE